MARLEIHPFSEEFRGEAARLLAERHARERAAEPLLPAIADYAAHVPSGEGAVATRGGEVVAYLIGETKGDRAEVGHGGVAASEPEAVRDLYGHLAGGWPSQHAIYVPASEADLIDPLFRNAFGIQFMQGVQEARPVAPVEFGGTIRESTPDDLRLLAELELMLWDLQRESPSYSGMAPTPLEEHEEGWSDLWDDADRLWSWIAERDGSPVGGIVMYRRPTGDLRVPENNVDLAFAATWADVRGSGAGVALTAHVLGWAHERGFRSVTTDWRSVNLFSSRFWPRRGFRPTHYRLYRSVP